MYIATESFVMMCAVLIIKYVTGNLSKRIV